MNGREFIDQLAKLLSDISPEERQEALEYYEGYFDEAGEEREAEVIRELGSPGKVAAIIKADLRENGGDGGEYTERQTFGGESGSGNGGYRAEETAPGYRGEETDSGYRTEKKDSGYRTENRASGYREGDSASSRAERGYHPRPKRGSGALILILILLVFLSPFITGAAGGVVGFLVALVLLPFTLVIGIGAVVLGLLIAGVCVLAAGIGVCPASPAAGILTVGIGCLLLALALVGLVFTVWLATKALPALLKGFTDFCHRLIHREGKGGKTA